MVTLASRTELRSILFEDGHSSCVTRDLEVAEHKWVCTNLTFSAPGLNSLCYLSKFRISRQVLRPFTMPMAQPQCQHR